MMTVDDVAQALRDQARVHVCDLTPERCGQLAEALEHFLGALPFPLPHRGSPRAEHLVPPLEADHAPG